MVTMIDLLEAEDVAAAQEQAAWLIHKEFNQKRYDFAWDTIEEARDEITMLCEEGHICRVALDDQRKVIGLVGGLPEYDGMVWELHPLVVAPEQRGRGIGRALVLDLEDRVRERGGLTVQLGSDDTDEMTSLANVDLYENLWEKIAAIQNYKNHPYSFYMRLGYVITGVIPDANGRGKPDIILGKRIE